jgi:hypothetical protein
VRKLHNLGIEPHPKFVDLGGYGYGLVTVTGERRAASGNVSGWVWELNSEKLPGGSVRDPTGCTADSSRVGRNPQCYRPIVHNRLANE